MPRLKRFQDARKRALIVAAHPDDESLFMGGTIAEFRKWDWTVLCVTDCDRTYNGRRVRELERVCAIYDRAGADIKAVPLGIKKKKGMFSNTEIRAKIKDFIARSGPFDIVFTHGGKGDYGHKTHKAVHDAVESLKLRGVYNFVTPGKKESHIGRPESLKDRRYSVYLSAGARKVKRQAINVYLRGSQKTNLSRLKTLVRCSFSARVEHFHKYN